VQRAYYCPPYHPFVIQSASALAVAARETGLEQIVGLSQWLAGPNHPSLLTRQLWLIDRMFTALPSIAHTIVNPKSFGAQLATLARFLAVPMLPGFNPAIYDRAQEQPVPPTPHLALDDADWTASHRADGSVMVGSTLKEALA